MSFRKGQTVIYPRHGVGQVTGRETADFAGVAREVLVIRFDDGGLVAKVAVDAAETVGLRPPIDAATARDVLTVLSGPVRYPSNFSRRFKNHAEKIASGDPFQLAEVVRNLESRVRASKLSLAESEQLSRCRQLLVAEIAASLRLDVPAVEAKVDAAVDAASPAAA